MKPILPAVTILALLTSFANVQAQPPGGGWAGGPPPGPNRGNQNMPNPRFDNRFGDQNVANPDAADQNMPTIVEIAQMMIGNFDADGSGGLDQAELQHALTALRQMMQSRGNGQNQRVAKQQVNAADAPNAFARGAGGRNNQAADDTAVGRPQRGAGASANGFRGGRRGR